MGGEDNKEISRRIPRDDFQNRWNLEPPHSLPSRKEDSYQERKGV